MNPFGVPEMTPTEVDRKRQENTDIILLDVREHQELLFANLGEGVVHVPLSELAARRLDALPEAAQDQAAQIVVFCHHGIRSAQVAAWLRAQGWSNVWNMTGGIEAWALHVDPTVGRY